MNFFFLFQVPEALEYNVTELYGDLPTEAPKSGYQETWSYAVLIILAQILKGVGFILGKMSKNKELSAMISVINEWVILLMSMCECLYIINNDYHWLGGSLKFTAIVMLIPMMLLHAAGQFLVIEGGEMKLLSIIQHFPKLYYILLTNICAGLVEIKETNELGSTKSDELMYQFYVIYPVAILVFLIVAPCAYCIFVEASNGRAVANNREGLQCV